MERATPKLLQSLLRKETEKRERKGCGQGRRDGPKDQKRYSIVKGINEGGRAHKSSKTLTPGNTSTQLIINGDSRSTMALTQGRYRCTTSHKFERTFFFSVFFFFFNIVH